MLSEFYLTVPLKHQRLSFFLFYCFWCLGLQRQQHATSLRFLLLFQPSVIVFVDSINSAFSWGRHKEGLTQILYYEHSFPVLFASVCYKCYLSDSSQLTFFSDYSLSSSSGGKLPAKTKTGFYVKVFVFYCVLNGLSVSWLQYL